MFCSNCGKEIDEKVKFCSNCGMENALLNSNIESKDELKKKKVKKNKKLILIILIIAVIILSIISIVIYINIPKTLASKITPENYGDYVDYPVYLGLNVSLDSKNDGEKEMPKTEWRIFYENNDRVFLIAADFIPNTSDILKNNDGLFDIVRTTPDGTHGLHWAHKWDKNLEEFKSNDMTNSVFGITNSSYQLNYDYSNSNVASLLLDTNNWKKFVDIQYADFAIGGPTIEMYKNSWESKGYIPFNIKTDKYGYDIIDVDYKQMSSNIGYKDNLYFPHRIMKESGIEADYIFTYWLASPATSEIERGESLLSISSHGMIVPNPIASEGNGIRPIIALKSDVLTSGKNENGVWQLDINK